MATKNVSGKSGLTLKHKIGYAMGDLGGCMTFALMGSMVTRYYTNILQADTRILAALLLIWNIWAAFKFIWNITPQIREQMAARRAAQ
ncbi:MAG: hypothetical protein KHX49_05615 [Lachnospiraceae bacterium]|nr:hypothetical protein [Lachnospiraceae bacterium]